MRSAIRASGPAPPLPQPAGTGALAAITVILAAGADRPASTIAVGFIASPTKSCFPSASELLARPTRSCMSNALPISCAVAAKSASRFYMMSLRRTRQLHRLVRPRPHTGMDRIYNWSYIMVMKTLAAAKFKEQCLSILDHLEPDGLVITKHGKPVARILPAGRASADLIGAFRGRIRVKGDILSTGVTWEAHG